MSASPSTRFHQIDFLRGIACLSVVAFHFLYRGQRGGWLNEPTFPWLQPFAVLGHLGVHLFFMISGFVILMSARKATVRSFIASRVSRLYPAFWVGVLLTSLVVWVSHSEPFAVTPGQVLVNLTMVPQWVQVEFVDGAYWSLAIELQFYLMVIALLHFGQMRRVEWWAAGWLVIASVNAVRRLYPLEFWLDARWASLFVAGMLFYRISRKGWNGRRYLLLLWAYALTVWYGWTGALEGRSAQDPVLLGPPLQVVLCLTLFHLVFVAIVNGHLKMRPSPVLYWFGALTYPVYLLHQNIGYIALMAPAWQGVDFHWRVLAVLAVIVLVAWLVHCQVERPLSKWLRAAIDPTPASRRAGGSGKLAPRVAVR